MLWLAWWGCAGTGGVLRDTAAPEACSVEVPESAVVLREAEGFLLPDQDILVCPGGSATADAADLRLYLLEGASAVLRAEGAQVYAQGGSQVLVQGGSGSAVLDRSAVLTVESGGVDERRCADVVLVLPPSIGC